MKKIQAEPIGQGRSPKIEPFLIPETISTPDGREFPTQELIDQCRRDYHSINLQKKTQGLTYRKRAPEEVRRIAALTVEEVQYQFRLTRQQAVLLRYRCQEKIRRKLI